MDKMVKVRLVTDNRTTVLETEVEANLLAGAGRVRYGDTLYNFSTMRSREGDYIVEFIEAGATLDLTPTRVQRAKDFAMAEMPNTTTARIIERRLEIMQKEGAPEASCIRMLLDAVYDGLPYGNWPRSVA